MFDFAWSEIALIAAVALIAIGPKDLPVAIRSVTDMIKKARRMAAEFQTHVDDMVREANLSEVRNQINEIRNFDFRREIEKAVDADGSLRKTFASNPLEPTPAISMPPPATTSEAESVSVEHTDVAELERPEGADPAPAVEPPTPEQPRVPAWVPPNLVPPAAVGGTPVPDAEPEAPAFIPPEAVLQRRSRPSA